MELTKEGKEMLDKAVEHNTARTCNNCAHSKVCIFYANAIQMYTPKPGRTPIIIAENLAKICEEFMTKQSEISRKILTT